MFKKNKNNSSEPNTPQIEHGTINRRVNTHELFSLFKNDENDPEFVSIKEMQTVLTHLINEIDRKGFKIFENDYK